MPNILRKFVKRVEDAATFQMYVSDQVGKKETVFSYGRLIFVSPLGGDGGDPG